jgi:hypothetical protein
MLNIERINKLSDELVSLGLDALYMGPSTDIEYLAGLRLFQDERPKGLMVSRNARCFALAPLLYEEEMQDALGQSVIYKVWEDHEGFADAFIAGCRDLGLVGKKIAFNDGVRAVDLIDMKAAVDFEWVNGADALSHLRVTKDEAELNFMRKAGAIADEVMDSLSRFIRRGITEKDIIDMFEVRLYLEKEAMRILRDQDYVDYSPLLQVIKSMKEENDKRENANPVRMAQIGFAVHKTMLEISGNRAIYQAWKWASGLMQEIININGSHVPARETYSKHKILSDCIIQKRSDSVQVIEKHLMAGSRDIYLQALKDIRYKGE